MPVALLSLVMSHVQFFRAQIGLSEGIAISRGTSREASFCQIVTTTGEPLLIQDARTDLRVPRTLVDSHSIGAYAGVPVGAHSHTLGSSCVLDGKPRHFPATLVKDLQQIASRVDAHLAELLAPGAGGAPMPRPRSPNAAFWPEVNHAEVRVRSASRATLERANAPALPASSPRGRCSGHGGPDDRSCASSSAVIDPTWYVRPTHPVGTRTAAGGVVVRSHDGEPLVALVREKSYEGPVLPKGGVEPGEDLEQAARREVEEEAGLTQLTLVTKLGVLERLAFDKQRWVTTHIFLFTTDQVIGVPTDTAHHAHGPTWRRLDDLDDMFWPDQRELIRAHVALIRRHV